MDIYDQEIEKLILMDFDQLRGCWVQASPARTTAGLYRLFSSCGNDAGCGCPTLIKGCGYKAETPELTDFIKMLEGVPKFFSNLEADWKESSPAGRRLLLQDFAIAQRMTDACCPNS